MESTGRLLSRPLVNGTIQKLHIFSHPLMIELRGGGEMGGWGDGRGCEMGEVFGDGGRGRGEVIVGGGEMGEMWERGRDEVREVWEVGRGGRGWNRGEGEG